jgi:exodeoxyribonuclease VIII
MVDLETMGNGPDAAICSIGAVKFDPDSSPNDDKEFYAHVNLQSAQDNGGSIDAATVMWWLAQSAQVTAAIIRQDDADHIGLALLNFIEFYGNSDGVWAAPATFDIPILESAMRRMQPDRRSAGCRRTESHSNRVCR